MNTDKANILIVDDEKNMRITLSDILEEEGYKTSTAADGIEALEKCKESAYDVILMDVRMPGIDGVETFRKIRKLQQGVRVIMMSAYSVDELKQEALKALGKKAEITRFKGLGEISPGEFQQFIGEEMRLELVQGDTQKNREKILGYYMGKNTPARQQFIMENLRVEKDVAEDEEEDAEAGVTLEAAEA